MISLESTACLPARATPPKVQPQHQQRWAVVYVRQSSPQQVLEHRESTALQYALRSLALQWGWPAERVLVIDQDLGCTGANAEGRAGFQHLLAEISLDHVGLVLGIEMSRLARSCRDWHQLLELCALFGVLLADPEGVYDPRTYNDRLLLGLKGTISEAELHLLHQRMHLGRLNKAQRGELFNHPPMGYIRLPSGPLAMDPDQQVQEVIRLLFEKFEQLGTLNALLHYLVAQQILLPIRPFAGAEQGQLQWRRPNRQTLRCVLHHPIYAGAYTWGRRAVDPRAKVPGRPSTGRRVVEAQDCQVFLRDRLPAYISWEQYQANRQRLADNCNRAQSPGAPRQGEALLGGLLVCGHCGQSLTVAYGDHGRRFRYACTRNYSTYAAPVCQGICGPVLDGLIEQLAMKVLEPAAVELSRATAADLEKERQRLDRHWQQQLERARYETQRAARQYQAVEPENRLVARELEKRWEQTLLEQRQLEEQHDRFLRDRPAALTAADRCLLEQLSQDIPALWRDPQTTPQERKTILRHLIERIVLTAPRQQEVAQVQVHWAGGLVSWHELLRPVARYEQLRDYEPLCQRARELKAAGESSARIAQRLNEEGFRPPKRRATFNAEMIRNLFYRRGLIPARACDSYQLGQDEWWHTDLARQLQMPQPTLYSWMRRGWVHACKRGAGSGRWVLWADAEELQRLDQLRHCPRSWHNRPQAATLTTPKPRPDQS